MSTGGGARWRPGPPATPAWRLVRAGTDVVPAWVRRVFEVRRAPRPRPGRARRWLLVAVVAVLVLAGGWVVAGTSLLGVREVRVTGTEILTPAEVREVAAVPERTPLLRVRTGEVADRIAATLAPVAQVRVSRDWPRTLLVEVVERTAVAAVPTAEGFALLDADGVLFHTVSVAPLDLPVVVLAQPGPADPATRAALTVLAALTPQLHQELETLTVAGPASIQLSLFSGRTVVWGDETGSEEKARVATALLDQDAEVVDVSAPEVVALR